MDRSISHRRGKISNPRGSKSGYDESIQTRGTRGRTIRETKALMGFHLVALAIHFYVFVWHFGMEASKLPGAKGFGFFFRYLTFVSFSFQLVQLSTLFLWYLMGTKVGSLSRLADDVSCATFPLACTVTILFQIIKRATQEAVEGGHIQRPFWLDFTVHYWNSLITLVDLAFSRNRTFSRRSQNIALSIAFFYIVWIHVVKMFNKSYPYPFLNKLPQPYGIIITSVVGTAICFFLFKLGELLQYRRKAINGTSLHEQKESGKHRPSYS